MHGFEDRGWKVDPGRFAETGRFGRMFPELRSLTEFTPGPVALGAVDGPMDGDRTELGGTPQDNPRIKAGYTFLGQFIDHDLTLDATSVLEQQIDPGALRNFRTPAFELDSVYGLGPGVHPYLYEKRNPFRLLIGPDGGDLPRNHEERALIGDPRNDENIIVSQLHLLFLKFHNKVFDDHVVGVGGAQARFEAAQTMVRWHYQWIVLHEFLPRLVGTATIARVLRERPFRYPSDAFMPLEFSVGAYRFGHTQVRPGYSLGEDRRAVLFPEKPDAPVGRDLRGGRAVPKELRVDWERFFGLTAQPSKLIDPLLSRPLLRLPESVIPPGVPDEHRSLATRNLQRGLDARLPAGQTIANHLQIAALSETQIWDGVPGGDGLAPLWFYILREGEVLAGGRRLAGVGAEIVARVFVALLLADRASFLVQDPQWTPTLPSAVPGRFTMSDMVNLTLGKNLASEDVATLPGDDTGAP